MGIGAWAIVVGTCGVLKGGGGETLLSDHMPKNPRPQSRNRDTPHISARPSRVEQNATADQPTNHQGTQCVKDDLLKAPIMSRTFGMYIYTFIPKATIVKIFPPSCVRKSERMDIIMMEKSKYEIQVSGQKGSRG